MVRRSAINKEILERAAKQFAPLTLVMQILISSLIVIAYFVATALAARAEMKIDRGVGSISIDITGDITAHDAEEFQKLSSELEYADFTVRLDSTGGNVLAAIKIGTLVRKYDGWTLIRANAKCYSSCALIFIAGVSRFNLSGGKLGIHRPYFSTAPQAREALEKAVPAMLSTLKSYINDMGITDNFYNQMVNTEPSQMQIYQGDNSTIIVPQQDPVHDEIVVARQARAYGVTTSEMRRRNQEAENCSLDGFYFCVRAIEWGLSESVYVERDAKSKRECWFDDEHQFGEAEQATIDKTPKKLRSDLPLYIRLETCVRHIMLGRSVPEQRGWFSRLFGR
jgi:hypothetical protein